LPFVFLFEFGACLRKNSLSLQKFDLRFPGALSRGTSRFPGLLLLLLCDAGGGPGQLKPHFCGFHRPLRCLRFNLRILQFVRLHTNPWPPTLLRRRPEPRVATRETFVQATFGLQVVHNAVILCFSSSQQHALQA